MSTNEKSEKKLQPKIIQITAHSGVILGLSDRGEVFVLNDGESPWQLINARGFYNVVNGLGDNDSKHLFKF